MKCIWCSKVFWFNGIIGALGLATFITLNVSPQILETIGIPAPFANALLTKLGGVVVLGNMILRFYTNKGVTLSPPNSDTAGK